MNPASRASVASLVTYIALTGFIGRNVIASIGTVVINDLGDSLLNTAVLTWNAKHIPLSDAWWDFPSFYPTSGTLLFTEHLLGLGFIASPIYWLSGNPFLTYNLTLLLTFPASALAMYALVSRLSGSSAAAFLAGLAFGFAPYRTAHISHIQMLGVFWAPLALLGLHQYVATGRFGALALFAAGWALQGATNGYLLFYFSAVVALWVLWFVVAKRRWRQLAMIVLAAALAFVPLVPILAKYSSVLSEHGFSRQPDEVLLYQADIAGILCAPPGSMLWSWLRIGCAAEGDIFPGVAFVLLCVVFAIMVWRARARQPAERGVGSFDARALLLFYGVAALATWALSWGPRPRLLGRETFFEGPFAWFMMAPGVSGLRVPARFWMMTVLSASVMLGLLGGELFKRYSRPAALIVVVLSAIGLALDGLPTLAAVRAPDPPPRPDVLRGGIMLELPIGNAAQDAAAQLRAVVGGWVAVNGTSGYETAYYPALRSASENDDPIMFEPFLSRGPLNVLVSASEPRFSKDVERLPGVERIARGRNLVQYYVPRRDGAASPVVFGKRLDIATLSASCLPELLPFVVDGDWRSRWQCGPQVPGQEITADLGIVARPGLVIPALGPFFTDFPRHLVVETSIDAKTWQLAWDDAVLGPTIRAGLEDRKEMRVLIPITPEPARYIRLRQTAYHGPWYWSIAELQIWSGVDR